MGFSVAWAGTTGELEQFFLSEQARGTGLALMLMKAMEARIAQAGMVERAHLYAFGANARARRFYEKCGWVMIGPEVHDVQISGGRTFPLDLVRYEKGLRPLEDGSSTPVGMAT